MSGRLSVAPLVSEVQALSVGDCMHAPGMEVVREGLNGTMIYTVMCRTVHNHINNYETINALGCFIIMTSCPQATPLMNLSHIVFPEPTCFRFSMFDFPCSACCSESNSSALPLQARPEAPK